RLQRAPRDESILQKAEHQRQSASARISLIHKGRQAPLVQQPASHRGDQQCEGVRTPPLVPGDPEGSGGRRRGSAELVELIDPLVQKKRRAGARSGRKSLRIGKKPEPARREGNTPVVSFLLESGEALLRELLRECVRQLPGQRCQPS